MNEQTEITGEKPAAPVVLSGHVSPETAYVVDDYPYGFRLRCKIRYWLETNKRGTRFVSQTTNPKRDGEVWNKPKASTYSDVAGAMFTDENGHVKWSGLTYYSDAAAVSSWLATYRTGLCAESLKRAQAWLTLKEVYEAEVIRGEFPQKFCALVSRLVAGGKTLEAAQQTAREAVAGPVAVSTPGQEQAWVESANCNAATI
jgi:hypothetical protein